MMSFYTNVGVNRIDLCCAKMPKKIISIPTVKNIFIQDVFFI